MGIKSKEAFPGVAAGVLGMLGGILGFATDNRTLYLVVGALALAAGTYTVFMVRRVAELQALNTVVDEELQSVKQQTRNTERELEQIRDFPDDAEAEDPLMDPSSGLFSQNFFAVALESRVASAKRHLRPVAVVLIDVVRDATADTPEAVEANIVASAITETIRDADTACRTKGGNYALLLEDTPENGAIWTVERIRRTLEHDEDITVWAGIACYPAHAFTPGDIVDAAGKALESAREWKQNRIEVAVTVPD